MTNCNPQIIGVQEVRFTYDRPFASRVKSTHQIEDLANKLKNYQYVYQPAMTYHKPGDTYDHTDEGIAIFSKLPILETSFLRLTRNFSDSEDGHQRICLRAMINTSAGPINFFSTHMSLSDSARRRNALEMLEFMNNFTLPQIIVGDFNDNPEGDLVQFLVGKISLEGKTGNFKDSWQELRGEDDMSTSWTYTTLQDDPKKRIDFVLYRGNDLLLNNIEIIQNNPFAKIQPSDHRGIYADITKLYKNKG